MTDPLRRRGARRRRRPVAIGLVIAVALAVLPTVAIGGETPPRERYLYVVATAGDGAHYGDDRSSPDILAVVDTDPASEGYGTIIDTLDMPAVGDNLHHHAYSHDRSELILLGLYSNRVYIVDIKTDPLQPTIRHVYETLGQDSGYDMPHTALAMDNGSYLVSMMGSQPGGEEPGGFVVLNANGRFRRAFGPSAERDPEVEDDRWPQYAYAFAPRPDLGVMISSSNGTAAALRDVWGHLGEAPGDMYVWDYDRKVVTQRVDLGDGVGPTELRWMHDRDKRQGFVHGTNGDVWFFQDDGLTGVDAADETAGDDRYAFHRVATTGGVLVDVAISPDDRWLYTADWGQNLITQWDISDPLQPIPVSRAPLPHPGMMRLTADGRRLYVTNGVVSSLDDGPAGRQLSPFNDHYGIYLVEIGPDGRMSMDAELFVDFSRVPLQNGPGPAGPHMVLFDPAADVGHH